MDKNSKTKFANRNRVKTKNGWVWLSIPLRTKGLFGQLELNKLQIANDSKWRKKHWGTIKASYSKAKYFKKYEAFFKDFYSKDWLFLKTATDYLLAYLLDQLGLKIKVLFSSHMNPKGKKEALILNLCKDVNASIYLSGPFGRDYLNESAFENESIEIAYHDYVHPEYDQCWGKPFDPCMSIIDLLFNYGPESIEIITLGQKEV
jgi:hypothetical protein